MQERGCRTLKFAAVLLIAGLSSQAATAGGRSRESRPQSLGEVNMALEGRVAKVEFGEGHPVRRARDVRVETEFTFWKDRGKEEQVLTSEVRRITLRPKWGVLKGIGVGLVAGAALGGIGIGTSENMGTIVDDAADAANFAG